MFASTLRENLRLARPDADDGQLDQVAARAGLEGWVRSLPKGWSTLSEPAAPGCRAGSGSGWRWPGPCWPIRPSWCSTNRPRTSTPTSARPLTSAMLRASRGRTTVLVTHDLEALAAVDEILVLDEGRVRQRGTHAELLARPGLYRQMWELEQGGVL